MNGVRINVHVLIQFRKSSVFFSVVLFSGTEPAVKEASGKRKKEMANKSAPEPKKKKTDGKWCRSSCDACLMDCD